MKPWLYIAALFGSQLVALVVLVAFWQFFPRFRYWVGTPFGAFFVTAGEGLAALLVVLLFAHPQSLLDVLDLFEFQSIRQGISYFAVVAGLVLGLTGVFLARIELSPDFAEKYPLTKPFIHQPGPEKHLFTILVLVGPVFEEIIMRGFLYRAFRESYGIPLSISIVVFAATLTHPGVMTASVWLFVLLAVVQVTLCLILEKTRNLWNCIVCHCVYNATLTSAWLMEMSF
ncbi:MAG TPA: CPBP family intramembrane glutamic endopeptidase [Candidatus Udaeobacter sp.]|nr:CPBP family intramembrane glutamic endopeptidase [Candidatus Udaeobacter sp.]